MHKKDRPIINKVARARYGNWTVCQVGERILEDGTRTYNDAIHQGRGDDLYDNSVKLADFKLPFKNGVLDIWVYTYELDRGEAYYELKENMYVTIVAGRVTEASWDYPKLEEITKAWEVAIPRTFAQDHSDRDLATGDKVHENQSTITYRMDLETMRAWLSDARHYSDCAGQGWAMDNAHGLQKSAQATVRRIEACKIADALPSTDQDGKSTGT